MNEDNVIRLNEFINHPVAKVWKALTDPVLHAKWWAAGDVRAELGHKFELDMGGKFGKQPCQVIAVEIEKTLSYSFAPGTIDTTITWTLIAEGAGTRLLLEHKGFDLNSPLGKMAFSGMKEGWPTVLKRIEPLLA